MSDIFEEESDHISPLVIIVTKQEVLERNIQPALNVLRSLMESPEMSKAYKENVEIIFQGYSDNIPELLKSQPVREYVNLLDEEFPFWFFFLSKEYLGLQNMVRCFLPPYRTDSGAREVSPERVDYYLMNRWLPAMSHICHYAGCSEEEINELADRGVRYIESGRFNNCGYH